MLINNSNFLVKEIPKLNPFSLEYKKLWKDLKIKSIEGMWSGGKWMPGPLFFFSNLWHIELSKDKYSKSKIIAKPFLRDLEWERGYILTEARGFSGFEKEDKYTCLRDFKNFELILKDEKENRFLTEKEIYNLKLKDSNLLHNYKEYQYLTAREYLRKNHGKDLGCPLFQNEAQNVIDIESRGTGKSFWMAGGVVAHNFLFDGATNYNELKETRPASETLIGAIDSFYSKGLIKKIILGMDNLEGGMKIGDTYYSAPLSKEYSGSWESGKTIINEYEIKDGGSWIKKGSKSKIHHRTFKDNPLAGNGTRPGVTALEEIGFFNNLLGALGALKECTANGSIKFGTIWMSGTGGDMEGGSTLAAQEVFNNPESYDCLGFPDEYNENQGKPIGLFVPAWMGLNEYKDKEGNTNKEEALEYLLEAREKAKKANSKKPLNDELQNRPIKPSEAFLVLTGNVFPVAELKKQLGFLESSTDDFVNGTKGSLIINTKGEIEFEPDLNNYLRQCDFPTREKDINTEGCIVIWEHPVKDAPYGLYVLGTDPYAQDKAENSPSLGACYVIKRAMIGYDNHDKIVAEYVGRPSKVDDYNEGVLRLTKYYNGLNLYENQINNLKTHFEKRNSLHHLAYTPTILKSNANTSVSRVYGQHMTKIKVANGFVGVKPELEIYFRDWLSEKVDDKLQLHYIYSKPLLKELIAYNDDGNFDRVIAIMLAYAQKLQMHRIIATEKKEIKKDDFFTRPLFTNRRGNNKLFM